MNTKNIGNVDEYFVRESARLFFKENALLFLQWNKISLFRRPPFTQVWETQYDEARYEHIFRFFSATIKAFESTWSSFYFLRLQRFLEHQKFSLLSIYKKGQKILFSRDADKNKLRYFQQIKIRKFIFVALEFETFVLIS